MDNEILSVDASAEGERIDKYLSAQIPHFSRSYFQKLILDGCVLINGTRTKKRVLIQEGDEIEVAFKLEDSIDLTPEPMDFDILYEDDDLIAINKPAGLVVHPGAGNWSHTFVNGLLYHCDIMHHHHVRPGIVHRLDKDSTGVLIAAKNDLSHRLLVEAFAQKKISKIYLAIVLGHPKNQTLTTGIQRHQIKRKEMCVSNEGKEAITTIENLASNQNFSLVKLHLKTGRTHQLRVHLKFLHCPILGDPIYGNPKMNQKYDIHRQLLHAYILTLKHPITGETLTLKAPPPSDMDKFLQKLNFVSY